MNPERMQYIYKSVWRFAKFFFFHWLISQIVLMFSNMDDPYVTATEPYINATLFAWISIGMLVLSFSSMIRIALQYEPTLRDAYLNEKPVSITGKLQVLLSDKLFWVRILLYCALYTVLPLGAFPAMQITGESLFGLQYAKLLMGLCTGLLLLGITVVSFLSSCKAWDHIDPKEVPHKAYNKRFRIICAAYLIGGIALSYLAPQIIPLFVNFHKLFDDPSAGKVLVWITVLVLGAIAIRYIGILRRRRRFLHKLEVISREGKHKLTKVHKPYASLFFNYSGESFSVHCNGEDFSCKMLSGKKSKNPLVFTEEGTMEFVKTVQVLGYELYQYKKIFDFAYQSDARKVLIINSVPQKMQLLWENKHIKLEDGDRLGDYILYTEQSFLNALERECLYR